MASVNVDVKVNANLVCFCGKVIPLAPRGIEELADHLRETHKMDVPRQVA